MTSAAENWDGGSARPVPVECPLPPARQTVAGPGSALRRSLILGGGLLAGGCSWIDTRQRAAVYRPDRRVPANFRGLAAGDESYQLQSGTGKDRGTVMFWWMPNSDPAAPGLLYLHGTFRNLYHNHPKMEAIRQAGFSVLGVEYRGWGDSSPILPSERTIYEDAELGWSELCRLAPRPHQRAIFGHSLGGGAASYVAERVSMREPVEASLLIFESSFTRLVDVARAASVWGYPLAWFATQQFDSLARLPRIRMPVLVMHGSSDRTVPIELGRALYAAASEPKEFVEFAQGSHSELHSENPALYQATLKKWSTRLRETRVVR